MEGTTAAVGAARWAYFLLYCARGATEPTLALFLGMRGYAMSQVATAMSLLMLSVATGGPLLSYLSDRHNCHARTSVGGLVVSALFALLLPRVAVHAPAETAPVNQEPPSVALPALVMLAMGVARAAVPPLLDAAALRALAAAQQTERYGQLRVYGTVGYALTAFATTTLTDVFGNDLPFYASAAGSFAAAYCIAQLYRLLPPHTAAAQAPSPARAPAERRGRDVARLVRANWPFFAVMVAAGMAHAVYNTMIPYFLRKTLEAPGFVVGIAQLAAGASEVPVFLLSKRVVGKAGRGTMLAIAAALLCSVVRMGLYRLAAFLGDDEAPNYGMLFVCVAQCLHGLTFSLLWAAAVAVCDAIAPPYLKATFQGLLTALYQGLAASLGSMVAGRLYQSHGPSTLFGAFTLGNIATLALFVLMHDVTDRKHRPAATLQADDSPV